MATSPETPMRHMRVKWAAFFVVVTTGSLATAASPVDSVAKAKKATALTEMMIPGQGKGFGSAFCIDSSGIFVTNAHVTDAARTGVVTLVVEPGEKAERVVAAKVIRSDKTLDLAILQVSDGGQFEALPLGKSDTLYETLQVKAFGYPFGSALATDQKGYPSISVNVGRISALRKSAGELQLIQIDA